MVVNIHYKQSEELNLMQRKSLQIFLNSLQININAKSSEFEKVLWKNGNLQFKNSENYILTISIKNLLKMTLSDQTNY